MVNDNYYDVKNHVLCWQGIENLYGYQECGLSGKATTTASGLTGTTQYYYKININAGGVTEYDITTGATATFAEIIALMNAENTGATWEIQGGDFRCRSNTLGASSAIALAAGTTGTNLFANLTGFTNFDAAVAGRAYRTNLQGKDTANLVGDTFFRLPGRLLKIPYIYIKRNKTYERVANTKFWGHIAHEGYQNGKMTLTMDMIDLSMLHYLCKACTTTDNTPAGYYTHAYVTTTAQLSPPPTFQMVYKIVNYESGNNINALFVGCVLSGVAISIPQNGKAQLTLDIKFARVIASNTPVALTTYPDWGVLKAYDHATMTIKKTDTSYPGTILSADIVYNDGTVLFKPVNELYASEALNGNPDIQVRLNFAPKDETFAADTMTAPLAPATASDIDISIKLWRNITTDYTEFAFEKCWCIDSADGTWDFELETAIMMQHSTTFIIKPVTFETGAKLTITEVNSLDDDRYET
ncbi:MAG: hypothetical protein MUO31_00985 [Thermodesulfovibrionales bacterium]|nr:hypothetical protein [Thermodesulfovibrionales bacterium]